MTRMRVLMFLLVTAIAGYWIVQAGSLEPPGPPAPTMKTLDEIPGCWHRKLGPERFQLVMGGAAVLDHETGLVWQREPFFNVEDQWLLAVRDCLFAEIGGRMGWRLPRAEELATLMDLSQPSPRLPAGHPFVNLAPGYTYWTQTTAPWEDPAGSGIPDLSKVFIVNFSSGQIYSEERVIDPLHVWMQVWCVRGGAGYDWAGQL